MHFNNSPLEERNEQERLAKQDSEETISKLEFYKQEAYRLGNNSDEVSRIDKIIEKFITSVISKENALEKSHEIVYGKEAGLGDKGIGPNTGGH